MISFSGYESAFSRNVCERHQHLVGSVTGSLEVVGGVRKAEREKGKRRRGGSKRDVVREVESTEEQEVNRGDFTRETRKCTEVRNLIKRLGRPHDNSQDSGKLFLTKMDEFLPPSCRFSTHLFHFIFYQIECFVQI